MSKFKYKARTKNGQMVEGEIEAANVTAAAKELGLKDYVPVSLSPLAFSFDPTVLKKWFASLNRVKIRDRIIFFRQLAALFTAGVPLFESLVAVEEQVTNKYFKNIIKEIIKDVEGGSTFSQALSKHPQVFSDLVVTMAKAGERGGTIEDVLIKITNYLEKENYLQQKIKSAMRYPVTVLVVLGSAFLVVITVVVPRFSTVYRSFGADLPLPTKILISINYTITHFWWLILLIALAAYYAFKTYINTVEGRKRFDQLLLRIPVFGLLIVKIALSRFFRMLSTMISTGIPLIYGLEVTASTADNVIISGTIMKVRNQVAAGHGVSGPMSQYKIFPPTAVQMVAIGEKSGTLGQMLLKSADYFDEEVEYMISNLMSLLEPILIFVLAIMVLVMALGIFLPMWNLMQLYGG